MTPRRIPSDPEFTTDVAPQEQWDCDVLEDGGEQRLRALTTQVMEACERLQDDEDCRSPVRVYFVKNVYVNGFEVCRTECELCANNHSGSLFTH